MSPAALNPQVLSLSRLLPCDTSGCTQLGPVKPGPLAMMLRSTLTAHAVQLATFFPLSAMVLSTMDAAPPRDRPTPPVLSETVTLRRLEAFWRAAPPTPLPLLAAIVTRL